MVWNFLNIFESAKTLPMNKFTNYGKITFKKTVVRRRIPSQYKLAVTLRQVDIKVNCPSARQGGAWERGVTAPTRSRPRH
jgi:hypothetical protein